jgi:hypothetical protein
MRQQKIADRKSVARVLDAGAAQLIQYGATIPPSSSGCAAHSP